MDAGSSANGNRAEKEGISTLSVSSSTPHYLKYRASLAKSTDTASEKKTDKDGNSNTAVVGGVATIAAAATVTGVALAGDKGSVPPSPSVAPPVTSNPSNGTAQTISTNGKENGAPRHPQSRNSLSKSKVYSLEDHKDEALAAAVASLAASSTVITAAMMSEEGTGPSDAKSTGEPSTPRYMRYRNSLVQSATPVRTPSVGDTSNETEPGAENADGRNDDASNRQAGNVAAAAIAGAALSGAVVSPPSTPSAAVTNTPGGSSGPRYLQYRNSLARSQTKATTPEIAHAPDDTADDENKESPAAGAGTVAAAPFSGNVVSPTSTPSAAAMSAADDPSVPRYMRYRNSLAQSGTPSTAPRESTPAVDTASNVASPAKVDEIREPDSSAAMGKVAAILAAATAGAGTAAALSRQSDGEAETPTTSPSYLQYRSSLASSFSKSNTSPSADLLDVEAGAIRESDDMRDPTVSQLFGSKGEDNDTPKAMVDVSAIPDPAVVESSTSVTKNEDVEAPTPLPPSRERTGSMTSLDSTPYKRQRLVKYGLGLLALVALPLGIGLGVSSRNKSDGDRGGIDAAPVQELPSASPSLGTPSAPVTSPSPGGPPTNAPTISPDGTIPGVPTRTPTLTTLPTLPITLEPSTAEPTLSPTAEPTLSPTATPTARPTSEKDVLQALLSSVSFDNGASILSPESPQNRAFEWLSSNTDVSTFSDTKKIQRYSLATLYFATEGDKWSNQQGWLSDDDECTWFSRSSRIPVCINGIFENLDLGFNEVGGTIPPELALLSNLTRVELSGTTQNRIGGTLPTELGELSLLESFDVFGNALSGTIPPELGKWDSIKTLNLGFNQLTGPVPDAVGLMSTLTEMNFGLNFLTGEVPGTIGLLVDLEKLSLNDNDMTGPLPQQLGTLGVLRDLNLDGNGFTALPSELRGLEKLVTLKINRNSLSGSLSSDIGGLSSLRTLELNTNELSGEIPSEIALLVNLRNLDLSSNELDGSIPTEIGLLVALRNLQLQSNKLEGSIPTEFGMLSLVTTLRIDENDITGQVPMEVCTTFEQTFPKFYLDCGGMPPEVICPPGACCTYCCDDDAGCECVYEGTSFAFLC